MANLRRRPDSPQSNPHPCRRAALLAQLAGTLVLLAAGVAACNGTSDNGATEIGGTSAGGIATRGGTANGGTSTAGSTSSDGGTSTAGSTSSDGGTSTAGSTSSDGGASNGGTSTSGGAFIAGGTKSVGGTGATGDSGGLTASGGSRAAGGSGAGGSGASAGSSASAGNSATCTGSAVGYEALVLCDHPVAFWAMKRSGSNEPDLSGHGNTGVYKGASPGLSTLPNGESAAEFNGSSNYLSVPSQPAFSIPTTSNLSWEAWIRPAVLQFPNDSGGYVDWMGKCADYSPSCEWEARMYNTDNDQGRCNRLSAYVFNPGAGLGSGADFQPTCGLFQAGAWYHVVGEYTLSSQPGDCPDTAAYPGSIEIWVNGVKWNHSRHGTTGCFSQYQVVPKANTSPLNIGTMALDSWFQGAIAKVAIYDYLLTQTQITTHYQTMTGKAPTGRCDDTCTF